MLYTQFHVKVALQCMWDKPVDNYQQDLRNTNVQLGVLTSMRQYWHTMPVEVELESTCLSGQGCGLCIALIRPNHWAASVAQWLEHLSSKQCVVGSNPTRAALFSFRRKKSCLG